MSRPRQHSTASTSYRPPMEATHNPYRRTAASRAAQQSILPQNVYIPTSQEERNRASIESRLLQDSGPRYRAQGDISRAGDATTASSTFDTYDRIGREDDLARPAPTTTLHPRPRYKPDSDRLHEVDESLIPGVGRGLKSHEAPQSSYQEQIRSLRQYTSQAASSPVRSPYRPGKYRSGYGSKAIPSSSRDMPTSVLVAAPTKLRSRQAHVETETESEDDPASDSADDSDRSDNGYGTVQSTGNHRAFAATPIGHIATMTANIRPRPLIGEETLNRIDFDLQTDTDSERRSRSAAANRAKRDSDDPTYTNTRPAPRHPTPVRDPAGPFASPRAVNTFGMNAANYQQHLASRTLTSPALRTLIGDRSKSPDSPTPAPSIDGVLQPQRNTNRHHAPQAHAQENVRRDQSSDAVSMFEDLARKLQRDVELTQRETARNEENDDGSNSNSGGSGFGPGSQASSARTRVNPVSDAHERQGKAAATATQYNQHGFPGYVKPAPAATATTASPWAPRLPDITGLTSALGSPVKGRDGVKHVPFGRGVGNQEARLEELANLRFFVENIQVELNRAGERILSLEETQEMQGQEVQDIRTEMRDILKDVRQHNQAGSDSQLIDIVMQRIKEQGHAQVQASEAKIQEPARPVQAVPAAPVTTSAPSQQQASVAGNANAAATSAQRGSSSQSHKSHVEVVNRLYSELDQLRAVMEEQYRSATAVYTQDEVGPETHSAARTRRTQTGLDSSDARDPWEAIEELRVQVVNLAEEVEGLNGLVLDQIITPRKQQAKYSASHEQAHRRRQHTQEARFDAQRRSQRESSHPASDPGVLWHQQSYARSSTPQPYHTHRPSSLDEHEGQYRKVSFGQRPPSAAARLHQPRMGDELDEVEDFDETIDAVAENIRLQREQQRLRYRRQQQQQAMLEDDEDLEDYEISQIAQARADRATARVVSSSTSASAAATDKHNTQRCTVCSARSKSDKKKALRKSKMLKAEERRSAIELEESILLDALDSHTEPSLTTGHVKSIHLGSEQYRLLQTILKEHWDEFHHQRMLYSELADELKTMSPTTMTRTKRRILAQHVLEAVECLELKADRISRLEKILEDCQVLTSRDHNNGMSDSNNDVMMEASKVAKEPGSRNPSSASNRENSAGSRNKLKDVLESRISSMASSTGTGSGSLNRLTPRAQKLALERERNQSRTSQSQPRQHHQLGRNSPPTTIHLD